MMIQELVSSDKKVVEIQLKSGLESQMVVEIEILVKGVIIYMYVYNWINISDDKYLLMVQW